MSLNIKVEAAWLCSLSSADRGHFLAALSHNLTVEIRVLCHRGLVAKDALEV